MRYMDILEKYLTESEINTLLKKVENNYRGNILNKHYFVKMGKNTSDYFYSSIVEEINLYNANKNSDMFPTIIDSYIDDETCVLILKRVNSDILTNDRYDYAIEIKRSLKVLIIEEILKIKNLQLDNKRISKFDREDKLLKYINNSKSELEPETFDYLHKIYNVLCNCEVDYVVSHGDIVLPNIMIDNKQVKFIDWEFIGYRPASFDLAHFLLFSNKDDVFSGIDYFRFDTKFKKELYKDGIYICLREISKFSKRKKEEKEDVEYLDEYINRFKNELNILVSKFEY